MLFPNLQIYAAIAIVAIALGVGGYFYVDSLQSKVETMQTQLDATQHALKTTESTIKLQDQTLKDVQAALTALTEADAKVDRDVATLRRRVNDILKVSNDPTTARPEAEAAVNALSTSTLDRLRTAMTGEDTDEGK